MSSPSALRSAVLASYRGVIRAASLAFKGDEVAILESRRQIRKHFEESRGVSDEGEIKSLIGDAKETAEVLKHLVVQSQIDEKGNLKLRARPEHLGKHGYGEDVPVLELPEMPKPRRRRKKGQDEKAGSDDASM